MAYKLISSADVKSLSKGALGTDFDALLDDLIIPAVGDLFARYCGRPDWDKKARTEYFDIRTQTAAIFLSAPPVASSPSFQLWEDTATPRAYGADTLLVEGEDYEVYAEEGMVKRPVAFAAGLKTVKATYTGGYLTADSTGAPSDLKFAALSQTKIFFDRREEYGMTGRSMQGGSISLLSFLTLPRQVTILLDAFKIFR